MQKIVSAIVLILSSCLLFAQSEQPSLIAVYDSKRGSVKLEWNMVDADGKTAYIILKSSDGISWSELVRDRNLKEYTSEDGYAFEDRNIHSPKNLYRLRIVDAFNSTVALSPIVVAGNGRETYPKSSPSENEKNSWSIYPNPVHNLLTINYRGSSPIQGSIIVIIQDMNGKIVIRYRCASTTKMIQIPVDNIVRGTYLIQLSVANEVLMSQRFIKQ